MPEESTQSIPEPTAETETPERTPLQLKKYIVAQLVDDNKLSILALSDDLGIAAREHLNNVKPGYPDVVILKAVKYTYNVEEVQND